MSEFYEGMADILDIEVANVRSEFLLSEAGWDSLAIVSTIALIDEVFGSTVSPTALTDCETVGDIERLVSGEMSE